MPVEKLYTLRELRNVTGVPVSTLRAEVHEGRLEAVRARDGRSAPILVPESAWHRWIAVRAARRIHITVCP